MIDKPYGYAIRILIQKQIERKEKLDYADGPHQALQLIFH